MTNWTDKEIDLLKKLYPANDNEVVAEKLNKTVRAIRGKAFQLRLKKSDRYWSKKDEAFLKNNWDVMTAKKIGEMLGKTRWSVINKYKQLKTK